MGICGLGGLWYTIPSEEVSNHEQSTLDTGASSSSCPGPGLSSNASASADTRTLAQFDVFLNHRGPDVKNTFVSHLTAALRRVGCDPFLDAKSLVKGQHALNSINEALTGVLVHVAIFSPGYAESKYCLNELCDMLASEKPLIPVFYDVEPENLRWTEEGLFAKAFSHHLERGRDQDVVRWKRALWEAAAITGFRLIECEDEMKLVEKVVDAVLKALPAPPPLAHARHPVGLKEVSAHVINLLHKMGDNVGVIGICGMGGIGKTTLAKEVYNQTQTSFGNRCILKDVKDAKGTGVTDLQMKMMTGLLGKDAKNMPGDYARWFEMIRRRKMLLVVDDVSNPKQFYDLIPDLKQLAPGSRVIITSRESDILNNIMLDAPQHHVYFVPELSFSDSLELFVRCAFRRNNLDVVDLSLHERVKKITRACGGVPLALEVIGGFLADRSILPECWIEATSAIRKDGDIMTSLQISYNGLVNNDDKYMFVDIACFMLGHRKDVALAIWNSTGEYSSSSCSLSRLINKSLVKVDADGLLSMHDLLRDMGRNIVMEKTRTTMDMPSHIWHPSMAAKILQKRKGLDKVLALSLIRAEPFIINKAKPFGRMENLRYLLLDGCSVNDDFSGWSEELRWLQWRYFPYEELPLSLKLLNLAVLDLANSSHLTCVWARDFEVESPCQKLQILILSKCTKLKDLPHDINKQKKLKILNLEGCLSLCTLPDSLGGMTKLEDLNLSRCFNLTSLPNFSYPGNLLKLNLLDCGSLATLPESLSNLSCLEELELSGCKLLRKLPLSVYGLKKLRLLCMRNTALEELPEDFGQLQSLQEADFGNCELLQNLCGNFGFLKNLQTLKLYKSKSLIQLPESFGNLSNLKELQMKGSRLIQKLPLSFCKLAKLREMNMEETALEELPEDFGELRSLLEAHFCGCKSLTKLPKSFGNLFSLEI